MPDNQPLKVKITMELDSTDLPRSATGIGDHLTRMAKRLIDSERSLIRARIEYTHETLGKADINIRPQLN